MLDKFLHKRKWFESKKHELSIYVLHIEDHIKECRDLAPNYEKSIMSEFIFNDLDRFAESLSDLQKAFKIVTQGNIKEFEQLAHYLKYNVTSLERLLVN